MEGANKPMIPHKRIVKRTNSGLHNWEDQCLLVCVLDSGDAQKSWIWKEGPKIA